MGWSSDGPDAKAATFPSSDDYQVKIIRGEREEETRAIAGRGRITGGMVTRMWCGRAGWGTYIFASALRGCVASSRVAARASAPVRVRHSVTGWRVISPD